MKRIDLAKQIEVLCHACPANARVPAGITAGDVGTIADGFRSLDFYVQHLHRERMRIVQALGLQLEGPDACEDGYPDLAERVVEALRSARAQTAAANARAWQAEERARKVQP